MAATSQTVIPIRVPKVRKPVITKTTTIGSLAIEEGPIWPGLCGPVATQISAKVASAAPPRAPPSMPLHRATGPTRYPQAGQ